MRTQVGNDEDDRPGPGKVELSEPVECMYVVGRYAGHRKPVEFLWRSAPAH